MLSVVMNPGRPDEQVFDLAHGAVTIGRTRDNAISCLHKSLSRVHARIDFDGKRIRLFDLQSKNGVFVRGRKVSKAELREGDGFRCGDIQFLVTSPASRTAVSVAATTLQSPLGAAPTASKRPTKIPSVPVRVDPGEQARGRERMLTLVRATELLVGEGSLDSILDEIVVCAVQVLDVDRICLLTLNQITAAMEPRILKSFSASVKQSWSERVVNYVVERGIAMAFADVSRDETLGGDIKADARVRSAMCAPINPGSGAIGVLYTDTVAERPDTFRPDELAIFRALASLAAVAMELDALRTTVTDVGADGDARETLFGHGPTRRV